MVSDGFVTYDEITYIEFMKTLGSMCALGVTLLAFPAIGNAQMKIDRSMEQIENSVEANAEKEMEELNEIAHRSRVSAYKMVLVAEEIEALFDRYRQEDAELDSKAFEKEIKEQLDSIRDLNSRVQDISVLDPSKNDKALSYEKVEDLQQFEDRITDLTRLSLAIRSKVDSFFGLEGVTVEDLSKKSLQGLTESVKRITKVISKASSRI